MCVPPGEHACCCPCALSRVGAMPRIAGCVRGPHGHAAIHLRHLHRRRPRLEAGAAASHAARPGGQVPGRPKKTTVQVRDALPLQSEHCLPASGPGPGADAAGCNGPSAAAGLHSLQAGVSPGGRWCSPDMRCTTLVASGRGCRARPHAARDAQTLCWSPTHVSRVRTSAFGNEFACQARQCRALGPLLRAVSMPGPAPEAAAHPASAYPADPTARNRYEGPPIGPKGLALMRQWAQLPVDAFAAMPDNWVGPFGPGFEGADKAAAQPVSRRPWRPVCAIDAACACLRACHLTLGVPHPGGHQRRVVLCAAHDEGGAAGAGEAGEGAVTQGV